MSFGKLIKYDYPINNKVLNKIDVIIIVKQQIAVKPNEVYVFFITLTTKTYIIL